MMRSKIVEKYPKTSISTLNCSPIYVADFTERTKSKRGVEVFDVMPKCPLNSENDMDVVTILNELGRSVVFATFYDHSFKTELGRDESHPEGAFFIDGEAETFLHCTK